MDTQQSTKIVSDQEIAEQGALNGLGLTEQARQCLSAGEMPQRYQRNASTLTLSEQRMLMNAQVLLVGYGGLGEFVLIFLARLGVGRVVVCDPGDCDTATASGNDAHQDPACRKGRPKVLAARQRAGSINPLMTVQPFHGAVHADLLRDAHVVVDCLGGSVQRRELERMAAAADIPLVCAAVAGWHALVCTTWPGEPGFGDFTQGAEHTAETEMGSLAPVAAFAASLQATEVAHILTKSNAALRGHLLMADLVTMRFSMVALTTGGI
jgi:molybdopterin-synthase adenylyltransferase